jgi:hypothetical protein
MRMRVHTDNLCSCSNSVASWLVTGYCATRRLLCYAVMTAGLGKMTPIVNIKAPNVQRYGGAKRTQQHTGFAQDRDYVHTGESRRVMAGGFLSSLLHTLSTERRVTDTRVFAR